MTRTSCIAGIRSRCTKYYDFSLGITAEVQNTLEDERIFNLETASQFNDFLLYKIAGSQNIDYRLLAADYLDWEK